MKRRSFAVIYWPGAFLAIAICTLVLPEPAHGRSASVALLVQKTPDQGGFISPDVGVYEFAADSEVTLTAVPRPGYQFVYWLGDVLDPTSTSTVAYLDKPKIIIAVFEQISHGQSLGGGSSSARASAARSASGSRGARGSSSGGGGYSGGGGVQGAAPNGSTEGDDPAPPNYEPPAPPIPQPPIPEPPVVLSHVPQPYIQGLHSPQPPVPQPHVPEPATSLLLGLGSLLALAARRAKNRP
ncbi:MAG: PEP-CTERM sorting domain-containing protein [Phycisphaerales bacterium]|nr:MAG: PEP-CTERM sorting domain-containing protein [Phycisphaerales bacterium]